MAVIMLCYARSGGTLLNKCLGSLPNTVVMSEVNPLGGVGGVDIVNSYRTVVEQAKHWYDIELKKQDFKGSLIELEEHCNSMNLKLVIRDWCFINYSSQKENNYNPPNKFLTYEELKDLNPKMFGFVRNSIDIWISSGMKNCDTFFTEYRNYVNELIKLDVPIFRYEDFTKNPDEELRRICNAVGLEYHDVSKTYFKFTKVNGDIQLGNKSRGERSNQIKSFRRKDIPISKMREISGCEAMREINNNFGYPYEYSIKSSGGKFISNIKYYTGRIVDKLLR